MKGEAPHDDKDLSNLIAGSTNHSLWLASELN